VIGGKQLANVETMNRSQLEIHVEILEILDHVGPLKLMQVMYIVNVNCIILKDVLDFLMKQGLVEEKIIKRGSKIYAITQLGVTVLEQFRELKEALPIVEKHKDLVCSNVPIL
jgi:predicted transcriptional regulator